MASASATTFSCSAVRAPLLNEMKSGVPERARRSSHWRLQAQGIASASVNPTQSASTAKKGAVLRGPEAERVDAAVADPAPVAAARVVADPFELEEAGGQMTDGVAADDDPVVAGGLADASIVVEDDLRGRPASIGVSPHGIWLGRGPRIAGEVAHGIVVLDEIVAPGAEPGHGFLDVFTDIRDRDVEDLAVMRETPGLGLAVLGP